MRRNQKKPTELICRIDVSAFLSIQLVLLFVLMVAVNDRTDLPRNSTDQPKVVHAVPMPGAMRENAMIVAVQRDGRVWLGSQTISSAELPTHLREAVSHGAERKVYIHADARARYGSVLDVLSAVRAAGIENIGFFVDEKGTPSKPIYHGL
jgi:biopolymer transport protein ExbD/biopolymer transport protein TolR